VHLVGFITRICTETFDTSAFSKWKGAYTHVQVCMCVYPCHSGDCGGDGLADSLGDHICKLIKPKSTLLHPLSPQWGKQVEITCTLHIHRTSNHDLSTTQF